MCGVYEMEAGWLEFDVLLASGSCPSRTYPLVSLCPLWACTGLSSTMPVNGDSDSSRVRVKPLLRSERLRPRVLRSFRSPCFWLRDRYKSLTVFRLSFFVAYTNQEPSTHRLRPGLLAEFKVLHPHWTMAVLELRGRSYTVRRLGVLLGRRDVISSATR